MESIINNPSTFGKLNCTLVFSLDKKLLTTIYEGIVELLKPEKEEFSSFNLQEFEMNDFDISESFEDDQSIRKVIFVKGKNKIILEYYNGKYAIGHLIGDDSKSFEGWEVINKYVREFRNPTLICGYELSLDVDEYPQSLAAIIDDVSLHPLIVYSSNTKNLYSLKVYDLISDSLSSFKKNTMKKYIERLNLPDSW